jgi:hypothetical protein
MKSTKSLKTPSPKSLLSGVALAVALATPSTAFAFTDFGALIQRVGLQLADWGVQGEQWVETIDNYQKQYEEYRKKWADIKTEVSALISRYNEMIRGPEDGTEITVPIVKTMLLNADTSLSMRAKYYFPDDDGCKQQTAKSILGSFVGTIASAPKARLQLICFKQKELAAMATQENANYNIIITSYDTALKEMKKERPTTTGAREDLQLAFSAFTAARDNEASKHATVLAYIQSQSENLQKSQRDVEALIVRGSTGSSTVIGEAIKAKVIGDIVAGTGVRGVTGIGAGRGGYSN